MSTLNVPSQSQNDARYATPSNVTSAVAAQATTDAGQYFAVLTPEAFGATNYITQAAHDAGTMPGDDTTALQAMFTAAKAGQGTIRLVPGRVYGATNLSMDYSGDTAQAASGRPYGLSGARIDGYGARLQQLSTANFSLPFILIQGHTNASAGPGSNNKITRLHIQDLELVGTYTAGINGSPTAITSDLLYIRSVQHIDISRVTTRNGQGNGVTVRRQYFGSDGDEYTFGVKLDHVRSVANAGAGFLLGDSTGAAVSVYAIDLDATANRLGGVTTCSCNSVFFGGIAVGNGNFGWQTVPTKQSVSGNEQISTSADVTFIGCRSEQTSGWAEFDIRAGIGASLYNCTTFATATVGASCVVVGGGNTGVAMAKPNVFGGYYAGNGSSLGQVGFSAQPTMYVGSAVSSGATSIPLSSPVPVSIPSGTALSARWYVSGSLNQVIATTTTGYTFDPTVRASAMLTVSAVSGAIPVGAVLTWGVSDANGLQADNPRLDYNIFGGGRAVPESFTLGTWSFYDAQSNPFPTANGAMRFPRIIGTQGTPPSGVSLLYQRQNASSRSELVFMSNDGLEHFIAEQADTASGFVAMPRESAYPMGITNYYPSSGTFSTGHFIKNTTPAETGTAGSKYVLLGMMCIAGGAPPAPSSSGWLPIRGLTGN